MVNDLVFRWPKHLFMVSGAHGIHLSGKRLDSVQVQTCEPCSVVFFMGLHHKNQRTYSFYQIRMQSYTNPSQ